jgi:hypothetical protein
VKVGFRIMTAVKKKNKKTEMTAGKNGEYRPVS